jgi:hypothetical protein
VRFGDHLVTDCKKANQGKKSHKDVESVIMHWFNAHTSITATKAKPFANGKQAVVHFTGVNDVDNPDPQDSYIDVTSTNPLGQTNQEMIAELRATRATLAAHATPATKHLPVRRSLRPRWEGREGEGRLGRRTVQDRCVQADERDDAGVGCRQSRLAARSGCAWIDGRGRAP